MNDPSSTYPHAWQEQAAQALEKIRSRKPRVHCITNEVASSYSANALLAVGAIPSMTWQASEVADFVEGADALVINLGTLDPGRLEGMHLAIDTATQHKLPFVLDPVFVERSATRLQTAQKLIERQPLIIRANAVELEALRSVGTHPESGSDSVFVQSGAVDIVRHHERSVRLDNGHPLMAQVTATGCAATGLLAACAAVCDDMFTAAVSAALILGVAGEAAAASCQGPGSLQTSLLDALYNIDESDLIARGRVL